MREEGSSIRYSPRTELDYGTLLCWATNDIGRGEPCVFTILPIGPPEPPAKCRTSNVTYSSFEVRGNVQLAVMYHRWIFFKEIPLAYLSFFPYPKRGFQGNSRKK